MSFDSLGLLKEIVNSVSKKGYTTPTPIQAQAIPVILEGCDVMGGAQTGTGKTAAFTLPLLHIVSQKSKGEGKRPVRALILTPTRELAAQVNESIETYGSDLPLKTAVIFGGVKIEPQIRKLRQGVDILVATPGRLLDHVSQKTVNLSDIDVLIMDEADRMLDMGFIHDIKRIIKLLPKKRQNLMFSATFAGDIKKLADSFLNDPTLIEVAARNTASERVEQVVHPVDREKKRFLLSHLISSQNWKQVLVFTRTKHGANRLTQALEKDGITAVAIHGNKSQAARTRALATFKAGSVRVLVATDVAARGLDIDQLPHVVNFELPNVPEDYIHRIGRTGRAGNEGEAMSLVCIDEKKLLKDIETLLKRELPKVVIEGFEPDPSIKAEPIMKRRGQRPQQRRSNNSSRSKPSGHRGKSNPFGKPRGARQARRRSAGPKLRSS